MGMTLRGVNPLGEHQNAFRRISSLLDGIYMKHVSNRLGGILKGGRLWRSNSAEGKKVSTPPDEPDVVKCSEAR